jgi:hypothetical protein
MISRKLFWSVTSLVTIAGLGLGVLAADGFIHRTETATEAAWKEVYEAPSRLVGGVDAIVLAKAVAVEPGRVAYSDNGEDMLPFEVVEFQVVRGLKGAAGEDRVFVERAGGITPEGPALYVDADGGPFEKGATYLLFLKRQEDGPYYYQVNNQGRFLVDDDRLWAADERDPVARFFEGQTVAEGIGFIQSELREGRGMRRVQ